MKIYDVIGASRTRIILVCSASRLERHLRFSTPPVEAGVRDVPPAQTDA